MIGGGEGDEGVILSSQIDPQLMTDVWLLVDQSCEWMTVLSLSRGSPGYLHISFPIGEPVERELTYGQAQPIIQKRKYSLANDKINNPKKRMAGHSLKNKQTSVDRPMFL